MSPRYPAPKFPTEIDPAAIEARRLAGSPLAGTGIVDSPMNPRWVRVTKNEYDGPITVGRVYPVLEWRKIGRRKGTFPRIIGDDGRTITLDHVSHYETVYDLAKDAT